MRFALLGNHPDGLDLALCLAASGRHHIVAVTSPSLDANQLARLGESVRRVPDLEEVLADSAVEAVIVASGPANRAAHLRRALQSERHVLCVHPPDPSPDLAYEAAMIRQDTGCVLMPLLREVLHPGIARLEESRRSGAAVLGDLTLLDLEHHARGGVLLLAGTKDDQPSLPGWHVLRTAGGEIAEVAAFAVAEEATIDQPLLITGRFEKGGLFRARFLPHQPQSTWRLTLFGTEGQADLHLPLGEPGPAFLTWRDRNGETHEETWDSWDPWPALVHQFEAAVKKGSGIVSTPPENANEVPSKRLPTPFSIPVTWQDTIRCLELDDAARRSVERRRVSGMEYQEASEEVGFKGTMTLVGCALVWVILLLFVGSLWLPWLRWAIVPVLVLFLALQLFRWIIPHGRNENDSGLEKKKTNPHEE
jgi:predicted dehydrogenase